MALAAPTRETGFPCEIQMNMDGKTREGYCGYSESLSINGKTVPTSLKTFLKSDTGDKVAAYLGKVVQYGPSVLRIEVALDARLNTTTKIKPSTALSQLIGTGGDKVTVTGKIVAYSTEGGKEQEVLDSITLNGSLHVINGKYDLEPLGQHTLIEKGVETVTVEVFRLGFVTNTAVPMPVNYGGTARDVWQLVSPS